MTPDNKDTGDKKFEHYQKEQDFEHELINRKITWLLTSQTILFAAIAISLNNDVNVGYQKLFLKSVPCLGIIISFFVGFAIAMHILAKYLSWRRYKRESRRTNRPWGIDTYVTLGSLFPDFALPIVFICAWWCIGEKMTLISKHPINSQSKPLICNVK